MEPQLKAWSLSSHSPAPTSQVLSHMFRDTGPWAHQLAPSWLPRFYLGADAGKGPQCFGQSMAEAVPTLGWQQCGLSKATDGARLLPSLVPGAYGSPVEAAVPWAKSKSVGRGDAFASLPLSLGKGMLV